MAGIIIKNVTKSYGKVCAVDNLSMEINDHEFVVILGPSGCGKSTLLKMIAQLEKPTSGEILIGSDKKNMSVIFQNSSLLPTSVYRNMALSLYFDKTRKYTRSEIDRKVSAAADMLDITDLLKRNCSELSGGQRQRVALGRAVVREPDIFLLDEPLSSLDSLLKTSLRGEIAKLFKRLNAIFVYVTHDHNEAMTLGERIAIMKEGGLVQFDTPHNIYSRPADKFVAEFIGYPPINFLDKKRAVRAENIAVAHSPIAATDCLSLECVVEGVEDLGREKIVLARRVAFDGDGAQALNIKVMPQEEYVRGQRIFAVIPQGRVLFFDDFGKLL